MHNGQLYFLLGREAHRPGFNSGGLFADFGGGLTHKSRSSIECAAQELQEETFKSLMDVPLEVLVRFIRDNLWLVVNSNFGKKAPYHLYCVMFPHLDVVSIFNDRITVARRCRTSGNECPDPKRLWLKCQVPEAFQINGRIRKAYLEKSEIRWVPAREAKNLPLRAEFGDTLAAFNVLEQIENAIAGLPPATTGRGVRHCATS